MFSSKQEHKLKHTAHIAHKNGRTNRLYGAIRSTCRSVFINHIYLYPVIVVTLFPPPLKDSMGQLSFVCAIILFSMAIVNCFGKKPVQVRKCIITVSAEFLKKYGAFIKTLLIFDYLRFLDFLTELN